jgi:hypothetical protein
MVAANKKSEITDLSQVNTRTQPTWIAFTTRDTPVDHILAHYGISEEALKAKGGGFIQSRDRQRRAAADVFIGGAVLANTPEQRMWYEVSQLNDLVFFDIPEPLLTKLAAERGYQRATAPIAFLRGAERSIPTVMRSALLSMSAMMRLTASLIQSQSLLMNIRSFFGCTVTPGTMIRGWLPKALSYR